MTFLKALITFLAAGFLWTTAQAQVSNNDSVPNPNVADEAELARAAQLDDTLVRAIVQQRPFAHMLELNALLSRSLSEGQREELYAQLFIPINLNTASEAEILLIPGMSNRMAHEFEEYRPYTSLVQFRREIGKYVDDNEVTRLERYMTIR